MTTTIAYSYPTREEAILWEIAMPIEEAELAIDAYHAYDLDAIADSVLGDEEDGWALMIDTDDFWNAVEYNAHPAGTPTLRDHRTGQHIRPRTGMRVTRNHMAGTITGKPQEGLIPVRWDIFNDADATEWVWALDLQPCAY